MENSGIQSAAAIGAPDRFGWVDMLRVVACLLVVTAHCCDSFVGAFDTDREAFMTGAAIGSLTRPSVPLFVMMTAFLLLPIPQTVTTTAFWRRRIGRVALPLLFWSIALPALFYVYFGHINPATANPTLSSADYTFSGFCSKVALMVVNFNFDTVPLWYLYMLVGLYLIMPVLNAWLVNSSRSDIRAFLALWFFTLFIPYIRLLVPHLGYEGNFGSMEIFGACDWNAYGTFYYVTGFIGYVVLACYLRRWPLKWSAAKFMAVGAPMFLAGYAVTFGGFVKIQDIFPGQYAYLEVIWYFTGINVFMMTFPILVAASSFGRFESPQWLRRLASLTFGVYLCHFFFVYLYFDIFDFAGLAPWMRIAAMTVSTFLSATLLTWLFTLTPATRRLVA